MDIYGIFGYPIAHSRSPQMHNRTFQKLGIDAVYVPFLIEPNRLAEAVAALRALNIRGVNITIPHKEAVLGLLDELAPEAHLIGAVNTIVNRDGHLVGHNTDCLGFMRSLRYELNFDPKGKRILLLGAGGAGRAVTVGLAQAGAAHITLFDRRETVCRHLIDEFAPQFENTQFMCFSGPQTSLQEKMPNFDLLIKLGSVPDTLFHPTRRGVLSPPEEKCFFTLRGQHSCAIDHPFSGGLGRSGQRGSLRSIDQIVYMGR